MSSNARKISFKAITDTLIINLDGNIVYESNEPTEELLISLLEEYTDSLDVEKLDPKEWEIEKVISIIQPDFIEKSLEAKSSSTPLMTDDVVKDVKRGDYLYITALLKPKNKSAAYNPGQIGVLKVKVVDLYYNLSALKYVK